MRILCDENIRRSISHLLEQEDHEVERVRSILDTGHSDDRIVTFCRENGWILLTNDEDFLNRDDHAGVFFLDEQRTPPRVVATAIRRIDRRMDVESIPGETFHLPDGWV
jgi:predicted nuclease of predicted toxin-antitoxin system